MKSSFRPDISTVSHTLYSGFSKNDKAIKRIVVASIIFLLIFFAWSFLLSAADYYVDSVAGNDNRLGTSPDQAWKTIAEVNRRIFKPGDNIYLRRGGVWQEQLVVSSSGSEPNPITFGTYGVGANPLIKASDTFSGWALFRSNASMKIWMGKIPGVRNPWGAVRNGVRVPRYDRYNPNSRWKSPVDITMMEDGVFYADSTQSQFYFRNDSGHPGTMDVGTRKYGIYIKDKQYVIIDSINVTGPGGSTDGSAPTAFRLVVIDSSDHVIVRNSTISNHAYIGVAIQNKSTNCTFLNVTSYGHGETGLYFMEAGAGNKAVGCKVHNCGNLVTDYGDMGLIGVWKTPGTTVENCYVHDNGHLGIGAIDAAISFVQSPNGVVNRCRVQNAAGTGIQFAENSDNGMASYNIIDRWGVLKSGNKNEGIRIGGGIGTSTATGCKVYNNLFINGGTTQGEWAALRTLYQKNEGLQVKNNIFHNNIGVYEIYAGSLDNYKNWVFSNNLFYRTSGNAIVTNNGRKVYDFAHIVGNAKGYYSFDTKQENGSITSNPDLLEDLTGLRSGSICIGRGTDVGLGSDFYGNPVPRGTGINIGPFQGERPATGPKAPKSLKKSQQ